MTTQSEETVTKEGVLNENLLDAWLRNFEIVNGHIPRPYTTTTTKTVKKTEDSTIRSPDPPSTPSSSSSSILVPTLLTLSAFIAGTAIPFLLSREEKKPKPYIEEQQPDEPSSLYQYLEDIGAHLPPEGGND